MDYKKNNAPTSVITRDTGLLESKTGNIYETVVVASRRANQIGTDLKNELNKKLEEFASYTDNLEEIFENREQIEISKYYERLPKPTLMALQEIMEDKLNFRIPSDEEIQQAEELARARERAEQEGAMEKAALAKKEAEGKSFDEIIAESHDTPLSEAEPDKKKAKKEAKPKAKAKE
ncbi:MAG: DNA-directed RNA polymerase subunit omega [Bacteroidales bacterium]|jgi:DNA-directed RNA polymerase subunit K/omega|nr:DNA-directed RNA polymerase subunit omega [Bacteroidales bacterium]